MALQTTGEIVVDVERETAFRFIQVPEQLAQCIPGCHDLRQLAPDRFAAVLTNQLAFMTLNFQVTIEVVKTDPPRSIAAKISGKPIGFVGQLTATASLELQEAGPGRTLIRHSSDVGLTGKLGGLGQPVFRAKSSEMAAQFGSNLKAALERHPAAAQATEGRPA